MPVRALIRDPGQPGWAAYAAPCRVLQAVDPGDVPRVVEAAEAGARREGLHAVGFVTYEAAAGFEPGLAVHPPGRLPPAWFALFPPPEPRGSPQRCMAASADTDPPDLRWQPSLDEAAYRQALTRIRTWIAAGDTYQVNFTYRLRAALPDAGGAARLFAAMIGRQPDALGAFIETDAWAICSASPELFFSRAGRCLVSRPMKGTAPRGVNEADDVRCASALRASMKDRAENLMITDMVRNDLGRLADTGSVRTGSLFRLEAHPTLWQMTSTVSCETGANLAEVFRALFPAASITGAPKRRTMEIIRALEDQPREIYTGAVGVVRPSGDAHFTVAIRTALVDKARRQVEYGVGGGIVWDSDAGEEYRETLTKARILYRPRPKGFALLETLRWAPDQGFWLLAGHLARLQRGARHFHGRNVDEAAVVRCLDELATGLPPVVHRVRLLVDDGLAIRVSAAPLDQSPAPRRVALARSRAALQDNPWVSHKTTHRGLYEAARRAALAAVPEADDVLLLNEQGEVTESTMANLVIDLDGALVTPPLAAGLLAGVYRQHLLESGRIEERTVRPEDLRAATALYLANSVRGLCPVTLLDG